MDNIFNEKIIENSEFAALLRCTCCGVGAYLIKPGKAPEMVYMTDGFCDICQGTKEEIYEAYEKDRMFGVYKDDQESVNQAIAEAITSGKVTEVTYRATTLDGELKWCTLKLKADRREQNVIMLYGTFFEVTEQMETHHNLSSLIHNIPGAICLYHFSGSRLDSMLISDRYYEMLGINERDALDLSDEETFQNVHPEDKDNFIKNVRTALTETTKLDFSYRSFNKKREEFIWINIQANVTPLEDGTGYAYVNYTDITKDKLIEQKLRSNEKILEAATKNAGVWYWNCHWRQNLAYMSKSFQTDFQLPYEVTGFAHKLIDEGIIDTNYQEIFLKMCEEIMDGKENASCIIKGYFADKTAHWMEFKLTNIFDEKGIAQEAVGVMCLVDEMKEIERKYEIEKRHAVEDKNLLAHLCFNVSNSAIIDYAGAYIFDEEYLDSIETLGQTIAKEAIESDIEKQLRILHDRKYLLDAFAEGNTEFSLEYQRALKNGKCIWVSSTFHLMRDKDSTDILLFEYCYDINLKKNMNILTEFAVNEEYDLIGITNMQDKKTIMVFGEASDNPYGEDISEDDYQDSMINFAENLVVEEDRERYIQKADIHYVNKWLQGNRSLEFNFRVKGKNNVLLTKKVHYVRYGDTNNSFVYIQRDITNLIAEQKKNEEELKAALEAAKMANTAKSSFLSQMSHEIRTPMNAIIGMTQLAKQADEKTEVNDYLNQIDSSSQYLLGIINDILDMSRIESGKLELHPQWINGSKIILNCVEMLKPAMEKKHINFKYPNLERHSAVRYYQDPLRTQQIFMNLLNNAVKFTPEGGTIELKAKNLYYENGHGCDRITITDTGCGMSEEFLTRIFHPFEMEENEFSSRVQGTGLGLALVKSFVEKMNGTITVESKLGIGSSFTFEIPFEAKVVDEKETQKDGHKEISLEGKQILLVDDHPLNRQIGKKLLESKKAEVVTAVDGIDACETFQSSKEGYFDAILMDIRMPNMDGLTATKTIRAMDRVDAITIPIIAMTANAFDEDTQKSFDAGMNAHLSKPIEPDKMMEALSEYIS